MADPKGVQGIHFQTPLNSGTGTPWEYLNVHIVHIEPFHFHIALINLIDTALILCTHMLI